MTKRAAFVALWILSAVAGAQVDDEARELERIRRERAAVESTFEATERDCRTRFAVTACVDEARAERRSALQRLKAQESVIDSAQRKRRAAQRQEAIRQKQVELQERPPAPTTAASRPSSMRVLERRAPAEARVRSTPAASPEDREAEAARAREAHEVRQREIATHRAEVERRNAERAAKRRPAAPLPVPSAPKR